MKVQFLFSGDLDCAVASHRSEAVPLILDERIFARVIKIVANRVYETAAEQSLPTSIKIVRLEKRIIVMLALMNGSYDRSVLC